MKIYIDVGHGKTGEDGGASAKSGGYTYYENDRNLRIAKACKEYVEARGHSVTMSRTENVNQAKAGSYGTADSNIITSASKCKSGDYDAMISIHCNDSSNTAARGFFTVWKTGDGVEKQSKTLCDAINCALAAYISPEGANLPKNASKAVLDNGKDHYGILRLHNKPGVLVEVGFMSNAKDLHEILCYYKQLGEAIGKGIVYAYGGERTIKSYEDDIFELKAQLTDYQVDYDKKCAELKTEKAKTEALEKDKTNLTNELNVAKKDLKTANTLNEKLETSYNRMAADIDNLKKDVEFYKTNCTNYGTNLEEAYAEIDRLKKEVEELKEASSEYIAEIEDYKTSDKMLREAMVHSTNGLKYDVNGDGVEDLKDLWDMFKYLVKK